MTGRRKAATRALRVSMLTIVLAATAACGPGHSAARNASSGPASVLSSSAPAPAPSSSTAEVSSPAIVASPSPSKTPTPSPAAKTTPPPRATPTPTPTHAPPPPKPAPLLVQQLASVGNAQQVITVTSSSWGTNTATLQTFEKSGAGWRAVFPPMFAHLGRNGFSANKHEGDGTTPAGMYGFNIMFGQRANPGVRFPYRIPDSQSVWVGDVHSKYYNTWQENAALSGEHLASSGFSVAYAYAAVIAYNMPNPVAGKGSAIFLHESTGGPTAGCVSLAQPNLLEVLRWLDPAKSPVIVMGPASVIRSY